MTLEAHEFSDFFHSLWGYKPFPWQQRLLSLVVEKGAYPTVLALGTGTGKTSVIDIHLFALALDAQRPPRERRLARRLFFVVDRRVIVDQTDVRAQELAQKLGEATTGILKRVADGLRGLYGAGEGDAPFGTAVLRGGVVRDNSWVHVPDQPLIVSSTVDQVGSRLLFRGYGVSQGMSSVHAGLVGEDALVVLDEVHLAVPFRQTLESLHRYYRPRHTDPPSRWGVLTMSATPSDAEQLSPEEVFGLQEEDRAHEVLLKRLTASRPARLVAVTATGSDKNADRKKIVAAAVKAVTSFVETGHIAIGVVVNRVDIARDVWADLDKKRTQKRGVLSSATPTLALVTGRMRGLDKQAPADVMALVRAGREADPEHPVIIVSTQSIEAGADLDFDAMVTQVASMDALRQRFGRLNRMGKFGSVKDEPERRDEDEEPTTRFGILPFVYVAEDENEDVSTEDDIIAVKPQFRAEAVILCRERDAQPVRDPIYGDAIDATSEFLWQEVLDRENGTTKLVEHWTSFAMDELDTALEALTKGRRAELSAPKPNAPILLPTYMELWTQTKPRPWPDPEVAPYLHGPQHAPDVQLVWRSDLSEALLMEAYFEADGKTARGRQNNQVFLQRLEALPPSSVEALTVPIYAVTGWLDEVGVPTVADVPVKTFDPKDRKYNVPPRLVLRWDGDATRVIAPEDIRVGDTIILPTSYGGLNAAGVWDPASKLSVSDRGEEAQWIARNRAVIRPNRHRLPTNTDGTNPNAWIHRVLMTEVTGPDEGAFETKAQERAAIKVWLQQAVKSAKDDWFKAACKHLASRAVGWQRITVGGTSEDDPQEVILVGNRPYSKTSKKRARDFDPGASSHTGGQGQITLKEHCADVSKLAEAFATRLGLPEPLVADIALAGKLHDLGKADPRFQLLLAGGDPVAAAMLDEVIAKSGMSPGDKEARDAAAKRSGYPRGKRHEVMSLRLLDSGNDLAGANDPELVRHLIASHHGWCRPMAPPTADLNPVVVQHPFDQSISASSQHGLARVGSGIADRFAHLNEKYGPHTLAWLETIVRLADHRASQYPHAGGEA